MSRLHKTPGFSPTVLSTSCVVIQDNHFQVDDPQEQYPESLQQQVYHHRCTATATATATATTFACLTSESVPPLPSVSSQLSTSTPFLDSTRNSSSMSAQSLFSQSADDNSALHTVDSQNFDFCELSDGSRFRDHPSTDYNYFPLGLFMGAVSSLDCEQDTNYTLKIRGLPNNPVREDAGYRSSFNSLTCGSENFVPDKFSSFADYPPTQIQEGCDPFDASSNGEACLDSCGLFLDSGVESQFTISGCSGVEVINQERNMEHNVPLKSRHSSFTMLSPCKATEYRNQGDFQQDMSHIYQSFGSSSPSNASGTQVPTFGAAQFEQAGHEVQSGNILCQPKPSGCTSDYSAVKEHILLGVEKEQQGAFHFFDEDQADPERSKPYREFFHIDSKLSSSGTEEIRRNVSFDETVASQLKKSEKTPSDGIPTMGKGFALLSQNPKRCPPSDCLHANTFCTRTNFEDQAYANVGKTVTPFQQFTQSRPSTHLDSSYSYPPLHSASAHSSATSPNTPSCDDSNGSSQSEVQSPSSGSAVTLVDVDHLLASGVTVAGFKPRPIIRKRRKIIVPYDQKDDGYWQKRKKNNDSAKRSREAKKEKEKNFYRRALELECENYFLKERLGEVEAQLLQFTGAPAAQYSLFPSNSSSSI